MSSRFHHTVFCRWGHVTAIVGGGGGGGGGGVGNDGDGFCRREFNCVWTWDSKRSHRRLFCSATAVAIRLGSVSIWD